MVDTKNSEMEKKNIKERTQNHLDDYARKGLRTLCIAKKVGFFMCTFKNVYSQWWAGVFFPMEQI